MLANGQAPVTCDTTHHHRCQLSSPDGVQFARVGNMPRVTNPAANPERVRLIINQDRKPKPSVLISSGCPARRIPNVADYSSREPAITPRKRRFPNSNRLQSCSLRPTNYSIDYLSDYNQSRHEYKHSASGRTQHSRTPTCAPLLERRKRHDPAV